MKCLYANVYMLKFLTENVSAVSTLTGVIVGAALTFAGTWLLKKRELKIRLWEKVLDRRIEAHEQIIQLSQSLRTMISLGYSEKDGELARSPSLLISRASFEDWYIYHSQTFGLRSIWLSIELTRELNLFQDYIVNLHEFLRTVEPENCPQVGALLRYDFIQFSERIEKLAFEFFSIDLYKLKLNDLKKWHKYPREETMKRLSSTALFTQHDKLNTLVSKPSLE